ncbi:MAG: hypothetical protein DRQ39_03695 [Gammaproteobacteria bacterium]|nr:MAG: hypothetical protein DRQ39_03695 [Gammaproteobacteria bacterium]
MSEPFVTAEGVLLYNHLFKPYRHPQYPNTDPKFSAMVLLDAANPEVAQLVAIYNAEVQEKWPQGKPVRDFNECLMPATERFPDKPEWANCYIFNSSKKPDRGVVGVVGANNAPITDPAQIHSGIKVRLHVSLWTFAGGVAANLHAVLKTGEGEPIALGTSVDSSSAFNQYGGVPVTAAPAFGAPAAAAYPGGDVPSQW